jgi:hypothetical protein
MTSVAVLAGKAACKPGHGKYEVEAVGLSKRFGHP